MTFRTLSLAGLLLLFGCTTLAAADKKITAKELPPAVAKAVQEETRGATIKGYSKEVENGKTSYEVETVVNGHTRDLIFDAAGHLLIVEEQVSLDAVPPPVKSAFEARGKVLLAETVTKDGQVTYEAQVRQKNGKRTEVVVNADGPYHFTKEISIGGEGGWDYLSVDPAAHRLYVSHATHIVVIDTQAGKVVGDIPDTPGVHGFAIAADLGRGFSSNGRENKVGIIDLKTLKLIQKVDTGENPDAILYEPARKEVYAFNGRGKSATIIDAQTGKIVATVPLEGKPESGQADSKAGKVYVNMEDLNAIKVIDTATHKVTDTWPIAPGEAATGMAFDAVNHRLFIGCDNKLMLMVDSTSGKMIYSVPVGAGVDSTWFDPTTKLAFTSDGESGTVTVAREESPTLLKVVQTLKTRPGARTMALDPTTHAIYLAATDYEPQPAGSKARPKPIVGTFRVLVYSMK